MSAEIVLLSPRQTFDDNMRPAQLLLRVYRLLDCNDTIQTEGDLDELAAAQITQMQVMIGEG